MQLIFICHMALPLIAICISIDPSLVILENIQLKDQSVNWYLNSHVKHLHFADANYLYDILAVYLSNENDLRELNQSYSKYYSKWKLMDKQRCSEKCHAHSAFFIRNILKWIANHTFCEALVTIYERVLQSTPLCMDIG